MIDLLSCNKNLTVLIETQYKNWSFIFDIVTKVNIKLSNSIHQHPIPYGTTITDNLKREMDVITVTGVISCYRCGGVNMTTNYVIPEIKRLSEQMRYCKEDFILLTSNDWQARYMILTSADISEEYTSVQKKEITLEFVGANLVGNISDPDFKRGGIVH